LGIIWTLLGFIEVLMRIMDVKVLLSLFFQIIILNLLKFKLSNFKNLAVMPRNWALVGISVHNFDQRFTPRLKLISNLSQLIGHYFIL